MKKPPIGFTLIEVLISLFILSLILFGFDAMEIGILRDNREALYMSLAVNQITSMAERIRVYGTRQDLDQQIQLWNKQNQNLLPQGKGYVTGRFPRMTISIFWGEKIQVGQLHCLTMQL